jgi:hypothetical protein
MRQSGEMTPYRHGATTSVHALTSSAQTAAGTTVTRYRPKTYQTRGKQVIQALMDIAPLIIAGLVVAFLFISAFTD